jgi:ABC-type molybdate transport system substrate-binding protein
MTVLARRALLLGGSVAMLAATAVRAEGWATDVGVYTEPTLAPAIGAAGRLFTARHGPGVAVLTAPAPLLLAQIQHNSAHDLLIVPSAFMDEAAKRDYVQPGTRHDAWRNRLVIATAAGVAPNKTNSLTDMLAGGPIAITDPTQASTLDGHAVLDTLGLTASAHVLGVANTGDAVFMVTTGAARFALVYLTDVRANRGLVVAATLDAVPPVTYSVALNPHPPSRNAQGFLDFLGTGPVVAGLREAGLELST